jgi:O-antigen/teichoic acid export membrane protein
VSGTYQVAAVLARAPLFVGTALITAFYPRIVEEHHACANSQATAQELLKWLALTVLPMSVMMSVGAPAVVAFFFPERYASAATALSILALGGAIITWASALASIQQARGRTGAPALIMTGAVVTQVTGLVWLVPRYGMLGAAAASAAASLLACCLFAVRRRGLVLGPPNGKRHALSLGILAILVLPLGTLLAHAPRLELVLWGMVATAGYGTCCLLLNIISAGAFGSHMPARPGLGGAVTRAAVRTASRLNASGPKL